MFVPSEQSTRSQRKRTRATRLKEDKCIDFMLDAHLHTYLNKIDIHTLENNKIRINRKDIQILEIFHAVD